MVVDVVTAISIDTDNRIQSSLPGTNRDADAGGNPSEANARTREKIGYVARA